MCVVAALDRLHEFGVGAVFHYVPLHSAKGGEEFGRFNGVDRFTTCESERLLRLPLWYGMSQPDVNIVISQTVRVLGELCAV